MTAPPRASAARCVATPGPPRPASAPSPVRLAHASSVAARVAPDGRPHPCSRASTFVTSTSQASYRLDAPTNSPGRPGEPTGSSPLDAPSASAPSQEGPMRSALPDTHDLARCHQRSWPRPEPHGSGLVDMDDSASRQHASTVPPHVDDGSHDPVTTARSQTGEGLHGLPHVASII